jgi:TatA/E family protein of Tat protein translocase
MLNIGPLELIAIFVVALLVFGPEKLPEIGRQVGRAIREFRQIQSSLQSQLSDVIDAPPDPVVPPPAPGARNEEPPEPPTAASAPSPPAVEYTDASTANQEGIPPSATGEPRHTTSDLTPESSHRLSGGASP